MKGGVVMNGGGVAKSDWWTWLRKEGGGSQLGAWRTAYTVLAVAAMLRLALRSSRLCWGPARPGAPLSAAAASPIPAPNPRPEIAYNKVGPAWGSGQAGGKVGGCHDTAGGVPI